MAKRDYYEILGIGKNATEEEIKKAYRKMAMKHHPDRNPDSKDAESKFKEAKEAYEMLSDDSKRAAYDRYGHAGVDPNAAGMGAGGAGAAGFGDAFGDIFGEIFGGGGGARRGGGPQVYRGSDLRFSMDITLEQAAAGFETDVRVPSWENCEVCKGSGAKPGTTPISCRTCGGAGAVRMQQGFFSVQQTCPKCHGSGKEISDPCVSCDGVGRTRKNKTLQVKIPAGIDDGMQIRVSGNGEPGINGGPPGDLFVEIHLKEHKIFQRENDDLICQVTIPFTLAALGGTTQVPTLNGKVDMTIPEGTQSGKRFRLRAKGIKGVRSAYPGDLHCHIVVETPVKLTKRQKELLREFETASQAGTHPEAEGFLARLKEFWNGGDPA